MRTELIYDKISLFKCDPLIAISEELRAEINGTHLFLVSPQDRNIQLGFWGNSHRPLLVCYV